MEKINLHFTGDFDAITSANNMIAVLLDNYIYQHAADGFRLKTVLWRRVMDVNDRNLRQIITGLGPDSNGIIGESGSTSHRHRRLWPSSVSPPASTT